MKFFLWVTALVVAVSNVQATIIGKLIETHEQCAAESQLTEQDVKELFSLNVREPVKCYLKCFMEREGFWVNGSFQPEKGRQLVARFKPLHKFEADINGVLDKCQNAQGKDECEKAFETTKCIVINGLKVLGNIIAGAIM